MEVLMPCAAAGMLVLLLLGPRLWRLVRRLLGLRKPGQRRRERAAGRILDRLATIDQPGRKMTYLRRVDPFTFEEMVLTAFQRRGQKIRRNDRYTGDGGIDGQVWIKGQRYLIQAKRYRRHINASHVRDFTRLVEQHQCRGLFVHTGRTGRLSRSLAHQDDRVTIISGQRLLKLLTPLEGMQAACDTSSPASTPSHHEPRYSSLS